MRRVMQRAAFGPRACARALLSNECLAKTVLQVLSHKTFTFGLSFHYFTHSHSHAFCSNTIFFERLKLVSG